MHSAINQDSKNTSKVTSCRSRETSYNAYKSTPIYEALLVKSHKSLSYSSRSLLVHCKALSGLGPIQDKHNTILAQIDLST